MAGRDATDDAVDDVTMEPLLPLTLMLLPAALVLEDRLVVVDSDSHDRD